MFQPDITPASRRNFILAVPAALVGIGAFGWRRYLYAQRIPAAEEVTIADFDFSGHRLGLVKVKKMVYSDSDWWTRLSPQQFYVTRKQSTDSPFTGTYYQLHQKGLYKCICCATVLFRSETKFDSGTGWPAFSSPAAKENVRTSGDPHETLDTGIEVLCRRCDAHLGHIFNDGPTDGADPTGLRYCINESSLQFIRIS